jgi:hypothetical protein
MGLFNLAGEERLSVKETVGQHVNRLVTQAQAVPKVTVDPNVDAEVIARVKHTMRAGEKLMQWYARTGLGKSRVLQMSQSECCSNQVHCNIVSGAILGDLSSLS